MSSFVMIKFQILYTYIPYYNLIQQNILPSGGYHCVSDILVISVNFSFSWLNIFQYIFYKIVLNRFRLQAKLHAKCVFCILLAKKEKNHHLCSPAWRSIFCGPARKFEFLTFFVTGFTHVTWPIFQSFSFRISTIRYMR